MRYLLICIVILWGTISGNGQHTSYAQKQILGLKAALANIEKISADNWMYFSCDSCIRPGDKSNLVVLLKTDLVLAGDLLPQDNTEDDLFDKKTHEALIKFQKRNGLIEDGILGSHTLDALNFPFTSRIQQIKSEIQHWKALDEKINEPYLLVNLPDYSLSIIDSGKVSMAMKVIIGRQTLKTPLFNDTIEYLVLNPSWIVPNSIATREILPMMKADTSYLSRNHMELYTYQKGVKIKSDLNSIDWNKVTDKNFNYQLEQIPGPWNALGQVKFIFPNQNNIYLHDSPEKYLFHHPIRSYSHGCIRVEKPLELAAWILNYSPKEIKDLISKSEANTIVYLPEPLPIVIDYFTSWIAEDGTLQFREDVYNYEVVQP